MTTFFMTVGLPGSGKDYYISNNLSDIMHISSDLIRKEVFGDINDQIHNAQVFTIMQKATMYCLKQNKSCVYNATNLSSRRRINLLAQLPKNIRKVCLLFVPPYELCLERDSKRERTVGEKVLKKMIQNFQPPHMSEGWDEILIFGQQNNSEALEKIWNDSFAIAHDNKNHSLTIGEHMEAAEQIYKDKYCCEYFYALHKAVKYHDIGKPFCKIYDKDKYCAHYYNHENVGAYLYLSMTSTQFSLEIANLIAHHMDFFKGNVYCNRVRERMGEAFWSDLRIVHYCDMEAH